MRRLSRGVNHDVGPQLLQEREDTRAIANIELMMDETLEVALQTLLIPPGVARWAEKGGALVIIQPVNSVTESREISADFGADEPRRTGDEKSFGHEKRRKKKEEKTDY